MKDLRLEKKFVLGKNKEFFLKKFLLNNYFKKLYPSRKINSIYLDTLDYSFIRDNIDGISDRKKIRFRWYNEDTKNIFFEIKNKKNFVVLKTIQKIDKIKKKNLIDEFRHHLMLNKINNHNYKFVLKVSYDRSYWISPDKKFRATIDTKINATTIKNERKTISLPDTILEFKFIPNYELNFRNFINSKSSYLRVQKYSKYVRSFIALEAGGRFY
jgi:hypothetical protein